MNIKVSHWTIIEADTEEEAVEKYVKNWEMGYYSEGDVDIEGIIE